MASERFHRHHRNVSHSPFAGCCGFWIGTGYATGTAARMAADFVPRALFWSLLSMGQPSLQRQRDRG